MTKLLWLVCLLLMGCYSDQKTVPLTVFSGTAMTMDYRILIGEGLSQENIKEVDKIIQAIFYEVDSLYNHWNVNSEVSKLNRLPQGLKIPLSKKLETLIRLTHQVVELTEGRFDPTIAPIQRLWKDKLVNGKTPSKEEIDIVALVVGWDKIHIEDGFFWKDYAQSSLDLGGIAKGYCVDLLVESLNSSGYKNIYVEWGGEIRTSGHHPDQRPWSIYISQLGDTNPKHAIAHVNLSNQAIATSGDYMQNWIVGNVTYFHIFNPQTFAPLVSSEASIASTSVVAPSCLLADGLATACMLFESVEEAQQWAETINAKMPELQFWIIPNTSHD